MGTMTTNKGGRKRTGTVEPWGSHADGTPRFRFRLRLADGTKTARFDVPHGMNEEKARAYVAGLQLQEDAEGKLVAIKRDRERARAEKAEEPHDGETCRAWFARYVNRRDTEIATASDLEDHWRRWLEPHLGKKPIAKVTRADIEAVRNVLDDAIRVRRLRPKSAKNVWGTLTRAMKEAASSKDPTLRVFDVSPCTNVQPPTKGESRRKPFFYPKEIVALVTCEGIPLDWRFTYACAAYLGLRPSELAALRWSDIEPGATWIVNVSRAVNWRTGEVKTTKTSAGVRMVPVPKGFVAWLQWERRRHEPIALVCPLVRTISRHHVSEHFPRHLAEAGIDHPRLFRDDDVWMPVNFRSLRDSYATWTAVSGVSIGALQRRLGHESMEQSMHYSKIAEDLTGTLGEVFPAVFGPAFGPEASQLRERFGGPAGTRTPTTAEDRGESEGQGGGGTEIPPENPTEPPSTGPAFGPTLDDALAGALQLAVTGGDLALVARIVAELEARRREAAGNVAVLAPTMEQAGSKKTEATAVRSRRRTR